MENDKKQYSVACRKCNDYTEQIGDDPVEKITRAKIARESAFKKWYDTASETKRMKIKAETWFEENYSLMGQNIGVAILDTGLKKEYKEEKWFSKTNVVIHDLFDQEKKGEDLSKSGHGSSLASIVAADYTKEINREEFHYQGIAPRCNLHILKCFNRTGRTPWPMIRKALEEVGKINEKEKKIHVVLLAAEERGAQYDIDYDATKKDSIADEIKKLREDGVIVVVSSGNQDKGTRSMNYPAILEDVISVGALYIENPPGKKDWDGKPTSHSQLIPNRTTILAPGWRNKRSNGYEMFAGASRGTSAAAATVAGALAVMIQFFKIVHDDYPTFDDIKELLQKTGKVKDEKRGKATKGEFNVLELDTILESIKTHKPHSLPVSINP